MRLVQLKYRRNRRVALVDKQRLQLLRKEISSIYQLVFHAISRDTSLNAVLHSTLSKEELDYQEVYLGKSQWKILPSFDHPDSFSMCMLSGTGLTHKASAQNRQHMHDALAESKSTDSMTMYLWGEEGGKPGNGRIGVQPEWFYKGNGYGLRGHLDHLEVPAYAQDGGEEAEIAGVYVIDRKGNPVRVGFTVGNEFSDHVMERKNYLYLAPSKLRSCAIGPELVLDGRFMDIKGQVSIWREGQELWSRELQTGEEHITHSLENLEYHHFKYPQHRQPGQVHVHFLGTSAFSFGDQITLQHGDEMRVHFDGFGKPLRNFVSLASEPERIISARSLI